MTNKINGKVYIGQTRKPLKDRLRGHRYLVRKGKQNHLYSAIRKYGWESFEITVLETCDSCEELNQKEIFYIAKYGSQDSAKGYNIAGGGHLTNPETGKKISSTKKRLFKENPELKLQIKKAHSDYFSNTENRKKHSETMSERYVQKPELKENIRDKLKEYYDQHPDELSNRAKERWLDPSFRAKTGEAISIAQRSNHPQCSSEEKYCPKCSLVLSKDMFFRSSKRRDGLECWCKLCKSIARSTKRRQALV